jgi:hypothetical protein
VPVWLTVLALPPVPLWVTLADRLLPCWVISARLSSEIWVMVASWKAPPLPPWMICAPKLKAPEATLLLPIWVIVALWSSPRWVVLAVLSSPL